MKHTVIVELAVSVYDGGNESAEDVGNLVRNGIDELFRRERNRASCVPVGFDVDKTKLRAVDGMGWVNAPEEK